ncbi:hypothetical protein [Streptomyces sp. NPDC017993]|uniref:hypothetical protein n=1 Tax=Streptomyces sp. NPDC017993 TaxID=3365027 RepID=UPI00378EF179
MPPEQDRQLADVAERFRRHRTPHSRAAPAVGPRPALRRDTYRRGAARPALLAAAGLLAVGIAFGDGLLIAGGLVLAGFFGRPFAPYPGYAGERPRPDVPPPG